MRFFNPVDKANELVSIEKALEIAGVEMSELTSERQGKVHCPYGELYHSDNGQEKTVRIYTETNSARCFRCNQSFYPVNLASQTWNTTYKKAAWQLLEIVGFKLPTFEELWEKYNNPTEEVPDKSMLAMALKTYCGRICVEWNSEQFESTVSSVLGKCLDLLDSVNTAEQAEQWILASKKAMTRILGEYSE